MPACIKFDIQLPTITLDFDQAQQETPLELEEIQQVATSDHSKLAHRDLPDQHPIGAITDLQKKLEEAGKDPDAMTNAEIDQLWKTIMN